MKLFRNLFVLLSTIMLAVASAGSDPLDRFFKDVKTFEASFNQVVLDEALNPIQESVGTLYIQRPNKFRWDYAVPFKQQIVSDGKQIWVYDIELQQVTVRKMDGALGNTPAILLAGRGKIGDNFAVKSLGKQGALDWMKMIPKENDGGFEDIRIGFENGKLRKLEMIDSFGHITRISLKDNRENKRISKKKFTFVPPKGVDVVRQ
jgi:outer membrane lipoprotein carrier protein